MMFDFLMATLIASGGFLAVLALSLNIMALASDAEAAYLNSVEAANLRALDRLQQQQRQVQPDDLAISLPASVFQGRCLPDTQWHELT